MRTVALLNYQSYKNNCYLHGGISPAVLSISTTVCEFENISVSYQQNYGL